MKRKGLWPVLVNIGFGNVVMSIRVVAVVSPLGVPMKRLRDEARDARMLVDATEGRRTRSIIITDSGHVVLSAQHTETIAQRMRGQQPGDTVEPRDE